jgi:hypothetical protein
VNSKSDSDFWRRRAEEARARASEMTTAEGRLWADEIVRLYEKLAEHEAKREAAAALRSSAQRRSETG